MFDFLKPISESKHEEVATDPRWLAEVQLPPFTPQSFEVERVNAIELALDRSFIHLGHG
jgi:hypothetical protein